MAVVVRLLLIAPLWFLDVVDCGGCGVVGAVVVV